MEKLDLIKQLAPIYQARPGKPEWVDVPPIQFLMADGQGDPNTSQAYADAVQVLYSLAYTLKFAYKKGPQAVDWKVMPLQGLWWADDMEAFLSGDRDEWKWTMMIAQPDFVTSGDVQHAQVEVERKKGFDTSLVRLETFSEGRAAQVMHIGPYAAEGPTIQQLHEFIAAQDCRRTGRHHEIYLGDPRRTDPQKLKTILRQPVS